MNRSIYALFRDGPGTATSAGIEVRGICLVKSKLQKRVSTSLYGGDRSFPYNPKWRDAMNKDTPLEQMLMARPGVIDVEHVFD